MIQTIIAAETRQEVVKEGAEFPHEDDFHTVATHYYKTAVNLAVIFCGRVIAPPTMAE